MAPDTIPPRQELLGETPTIEYRVHPRYRLLQRCLVRPQGAPRSECWRCIAHNLSVAGVGITMPCALPAGTVLEIEPWELPRAQPLQAAIVHSRAVDFLYFVGCSMVRLLSDAEVQVWVKGQRNWLPEDQPNLRCWLEEFTPL